MAQTSYFVPHPMVPTSPAAASPTAAGHMAIVTQEPKSAPDTPAGAGNTNVDVPGGPKAGPGGPQGPVQPCGLGDSNMFLFMGLGLAAMYFLVMRPEQKRKKQQMDMLAAIKVGDTVVTLGGMHGVVAQLSEKTVTLRVDTARMTFDRTAITRVQRDEPATSGDAKKA